MKTDLYTKFILTVIALALSGIAIQLTIKEAHAQSGFSFTPSGALMVTICDLGHSYRTVVCAEAAKLEHQ
ncbi:MAG: hypothetical protein EXQ97_01840 [Alphaproteobacteria bacterium]|nr:hypothetical protein [Alphaproteobacteria bacterium]